ncbi:helix-turn-helix domain-containing protein [Schauerella aestuarii]|uniref:helix-turn-helix domain-containing protein n=1 Tax=Schauerella aestuarii TaxID=2511204 RepID=UPI00136BC2FE|nr:XRE family transcriptional regulator [Achromobacter aestuarii]
MTLATRLRARMRWRGITSQQELSRISGVAQSCIHRILTRGEGYSPKRNTLIALARALDTTAVWLSDGIEFANPMPQPSRTNVALNDVDGGAGYAHIACTTAASADALPLTPRDREHAEIDRLVRTLAPAERSALLAIVRLIARGRTHNATPASS